MNASAVIADSPLRQAWPRASRGQAGGLVARSVDILFQVCLPSARLRAPVSLGDCAISRRTVVNMRVLKQAAVGKDIQKPAYLPPDLIRRHVIIGLGQLLHHVIDRPFTRAKTRNGRGGMVQLESCFWVQEQVAAGTPIEPKTSFRTKPRPDCGESHELFACVLFPFRHTPERDDRAWSTEYRPS